MPLLTDRLDMTSLLTGPKNSNTNTNTFVKGCTEHLHKTFSDLVFEINANERNKVLKLARNNFKCKTHDEDEINSR